MSVTTADVLASTVMLAQAGVSGVVSSGLVASRVGSSGMATASDVLASTAALPLAGASGVISSGGLVSRVAASGVAADAPVSGVAVLASEPASVLSASDGTLTLLSVVMPAKYKVR